MALRLVGIGGLGKMLGPSATHLRDGGVARYLRMLDRGTKDEYRDQCRKAWHEHGTKLVPSFAELIGDGDFDGVVICAGKNGDDYKIIKELVLSNKIKSKFILHLSTVSCDFVRATAEFCKKHTVHYVNYPLTGGAKGAASAKMLVLASGDEVFYQRLLPMLQLIGVPKYFGENAANAAAVKLIGHVLVFHGLLGISLAAVLHQSIFQYDSLNEKQIEFFDFLNNGAGGTRQWDVTLRQALQNNNWQDGFLLKHAVIDAIYTAQLLVENNIPGLLILPLMEVTLLFSYLLNQPQSDTLATSAVADLISRAPQELPDSFIKKNISLDINLCIKNCVLSLPDQIRQTLMLDVMY